MREPIEAEYFNWLCAKVLEPGSQIYHDLLRTLYTIEFTWDVVGDRNRAEDGLELRLDFLRMSNWEDEDWRAQPCSVLEMLIAFSNRAAFQTDIPSQNWFWIFMENLDLAEYRQLSRTDEIIVRDYIQTFVSRSYDESGLGGIFPMRWPKHDQRNIELYYQFCEWLEDRGMM